MKPAIPAAVVELIKANPLKSDKETSRLLAGDVKFGLEAYKKIAVYHGPRGNWWRVFRELRLLLGLGVKDVFRRMHPKELRWFAEWSLESGFIEDAFAAYELISKIKDASIDDRADVRYLIALLNCGRNEDVLRVVDDAIGDEEEPEDYPDQERYAAQALVALKRPVEAVERLRRVLQRYHDDGYLWAQLAIAYSHLGKSAERQMAIVEAAKCGLYNPYNQLGLRDRLLAELHISSEEWTKLHAPYKLSSGFEENQNAWRKTPGAYFQLSQKGAHILGGKTFKMPSCRGCGRRIRQAFVINVRAHRPLAKLLPDWTLLPLLLCPDCSVQMGRHDYEIDLNKLSVRLVNVAFNVREFGTPHHRTPPIPRRSVKLVTLPSNLSDKELMKYGDLGTQVGGCPIWIQDPLRVFCRTCRNEMVYVASLCDKRDFKPCLQIAGYLYHFACNECKTISVIAQWS